MLNLVACGLSTAFAPTRDETLEKMAQDRAPFFLNATFIDRQFQPQLCAFRDNQAISTFPQRAKTLLKEALDDLVTQLAGGDLRGQTADLILVLPEVNAEEGLEREALGQLGNALCDTIGHALLDGPGLHVAQRTIRASGHAGVGSALTGLVGDSDGKTVLIAAVDSYSDRARLNHLNETQRLFSSESKFGFVPGEAAGVMLLASQGPSGVAVCGAGEGVEAVTELAEAEGRFNALSEAAFAACEMALEPRNRAVGQWYADWNNSRYRATELSFAMQRINPFFLRDGVEPFYPALNFGDVGAAFGVLAMALTQAQSIRTEQVEYSLISATSTLKGLRSTILLNHNPEISRSPP